MARSGNYRSGTGAGIAFIRAHLADEDGPCLVWPLFRDKHGYGTVYWLGDRYWAHRLTCILAHGQPPTDEHYAAHSCGNGHLGCIHPKHVGWKTPAENQADRRVHGTSGLGKKRQRYILTPEQVAEIRALKGQKTQSALASIYGVKRQTIGEIMRGEIWKTGQRSPHKFNSITGAAASAARAKLKALRA